MKVSRCTWRGRMLHEDCEYEFLQQQPASSITASGAVTQLLTLTAADLAAMSRAKATTTSNGITTVYEGVAVADVLKKGAGAPLGAGMRGNALSTYVLASASDGYQAVLSLGELDPDVTDGEFLLVDTTNGKSMFGETGAFVCSCRKTNAAHVRCAC